jgi:bacillithiol biosynthesis deacetylase BshB1
VVLADATRGEQGTRATAEERAEEATAAAAILGVERVNLGLPDGGIGNDMEASTRRVVQLIRHHRPRLVFTHSAGDHHPDHNALSEAVKRAVFLSYVMKYDTGQERHAPKRLLYFWSHRHDLPEKVSFVADITPHWETKLASIKAHRSQFAGTGYDGPQTYLTSDGFWQRIEARHTFFGALIQRPYGEPYISEGVLRVDDPLELPGH